MQDCFDTLYAQSVGGHHFYDLTELMSSPDNIRLAYRNIKRNTGSKTAGTDKLMINDIQHLAVEVLSSWVSKIITQSLQTFLSI